jgi:glycerol kinase
MINVKDTKPRLKSGVLSVGWFQEGKVDFVAEGNIHSSGDTIKWLVEQMGWQVRSKKLKDSQCRSKTTTVFTLSQLLLVWVRRIGKTMRAH